MKAVALIVAAVPILLVIAQIILILVVIGQMINGKLDLDKDNENH